MQINLLFEVCYGIECGKDDESRLFYAPRNENYNDLLTFKNFPEPHSCSCKVHVCISSLLQFSIVSSWELSSFQGLRTITHEPLLKWQEWGEGRDLRFKILIISKEFWQCQCIMRVGMMYNLVIIFLTRIAIARILFFFSGPWKLPYSSPYLQTLFQFDGSKGPNTLALAVCQNWDHDPGQDVHGPCLIYEIECGDDDESRLFYVPRDSLR